MEVFFDETGSFDPHDSSQDGIYAVMGLIIPHCASSLLEQDFTGFRRALPPSAFTRGEPKRASARPENCHLLAQIITAHSPVMLVPVTLPISSSQPEFLGELPRQIKEMFRIEAHKHLRDKRLVQVKEWAARSGNLSPAQWFKLASYSEALFRLRVGIAKFYQCHQFISELESVRVTFDGGGRQDNREELVLDLLPLFWEMMRLDSTSGYGDDLKGALQDGCPFPKFGKLRFGNSQTTWQLQLADLVVKAWANTIRDFRGTRGYLQNFRLLHQNTINSPEDALGMMAIRSSSGHIPLPEQFEIFQRIAFGVEKILPCAAV